MAGWQVRQPINAIRISASEVWSVEHENNSAHVLMNFTVEFYYSRSIEDLCGRTIAFAIAPQVKSLRLRIGKDVVIEIVAIWKRYGGSDLDRQQSRPELRWAD